MYKAGELLIMEFGEYSDFMYAGPFKVIKDFDLEVVKALQPKDEDGNYDYLSITDVAAKLAKEGYIEDVPSRVIDLGSYGELSPRDETKQ